MVCHCFYCAKITILRKINKFFPHKKQSGIIFFVSKSIREGSGIDFFVNESIREGSEIVFFVNQTIREGSGIDSFVNKIIFEGAGTVYYAIAHPDHTLCGIHTAFTRYFSISIME